jgi:hypothetical protein
MLKRILGISELYISQKSSSFSDDIEHPDFHPENPEKVTRTTPESTFISNSISPSDS